MDLMVIPLLLIGAIAGMAGGLIFYILGEWRVKRRGRETDARTAARHEGKEVSEEHWTEKEQNQIDIGVQSRMDSFYNSSSSNNNKKR